MGCLKSSEAGRDEDCLMLGRLPTGVLFSPLFGGCGQDGEDEGNDGENYREDGKEEGEDTCHIFLQLVYRIDAIQENKAPKKEL